MVKNVKTIFSRKVLAAVLFGAVGVTALALTNAAVPTANFEAESGTRSIAQVASDVTASGGSAIRFLSAPASTDPLQISKKCTDLASLKFCDDFDGAAGTYPDATKWGVAGSGSFWGSQCWKKDPANISLTGNGQLKQTLINTGTTQCTDEFGDPTSVTSGYIDSAKNGTAKNNFTYGKFEIRAKIGCGSGVWGAIWLSTGTTAGVSWPQAGEIDIYELMNDQPTKLKNTIHYGNSPEEHGQKGAEVLAPNGARWCDDWHVYGANWTPNYVQFTVDGQLQKKYVPSDTQPYNWPFTKPLRLIIDLQYARKTTTFRGTANISQLPISMLVDYVRVYDESTIPASVPTGPTLPAAGGELSVPASIVATPGTGSVKLDWEDIPGADNYTVRWGTGGAWTVYSNAPGRGGNPTTSTYTVTGLTKGTNYNFSVRAKNSAGTYADSSYTSATYAVPN